jgi:hypothetical protein
MDLEYQMQAFSHFMVFRPEWPLLEADYLPCGA